jgi:ribosomal protein L44E
MAKYVIREFVGGKMVGHEVEGETKEEALKVFEAGLPAMRAEREAAEKLTKEVTKDSVESAAKMNGRKYVALEFRCSSCGTALEAVFRDGVLEIAPCPVCLEELGNMVEAGRRFMERKRAT